MDRPAHDGPIHDDDNATPPAWVRYGMSREDWQVHPARGLADRLNGLGLAGLAGDDRTDAILTVLAEWLEDVELTHSPIVREGPADDWHPRALASSFVRVNIRQELRRRQR